METVTTISKTPIWKILTKQNLDLNDTVDLNSTSTKTGLLVYDYIIPCIGSLIILLNLVVVISSGLILRKGQQPRSTYLFLGNVAAADLVTGVAVVFGQAFPKEKRDYYICAVQLGLIVSSTLASVYSVGLIGIDRFLYILHGMQYQRWVYPTRARLLICLVWIIGLVIGFLPLMGWQDDNTNNGSICWFILLAPKQLILLTVTVGAIPITVVVCLYSIILYHAIKKSIQIRRQIRNCNVANIEENFSTGLRMFRGGNTSENEEDVEPTTKGIFRFFKKKPSPSVKSPSKWKAIKVVAFTTGSFFITWYPYFIVSVIYVFSCDMEDTSKECKTMRLLIASPLAILGFMNSFLNPLIYAWWHKGFRTFFKKKINVMIKKNRQSEETTTTASHSKSTSCKYASESNVKNMSIRGKPTPKDCDSSVYY